MIDHNQANAAVLREVAFRAARQPEYAQAGMLRHASRWWFDRRGCVMLYAWAGAKYPMPRFPSWAGRADRPAATVVSRAGATFADGVWWFGPEKIGKGGASEGINRDAIQHTAYDGGANVGLMPNSPTRLTVAQTASAEYRLTWQYNPTNEQVAPDEFVVFYDNGTGTIDYATEVAVITYTPPRQVYAWVSSQYADGTAMKWAVFARTGSVYSLVALAGSDPTEPWVSYFDQASPSAARLVGALIEVSEPTAPPAPEVV